MILSLLQRLIYIHAGSYLSSAIYKEQVMSIMFRVLPRFTGTSKEPSIGSIGAVHVISGEGMSGTIEQYRLSPVLPRHTDALLNRIM